MRAAAGTAIGPLLLCLLLTGCRSVDRTLEELHLPCGVYRWPIKTLTDPEREQVHRVPVRATVRELVELPLPPGGIAMKRRSDRELRLYKVRALLIGVHPRLDQDLHLFLRDPSDAGAKMIAEIPDPRCTPDSPYRADFEAARRVANDLRGRREPTTVEVWGVGFFDGLHESKEGAPNGFELHPVIRLTELK